MNLKKVIQEEISKVLSEGASIRSGIRMQNQKPIPKQFDHLKWSLNDGQKYYLGDLCAVKPDSITEADVKHASKFLGIPEKNVKSIINTYNSYDPMSETFVELKKDSPLMKGISSVDAGLNAMEINKAPGRSNKTFSPMQTNQTNLERKTMDYAVRKNRVLDREGKLDEKKAYYENVHTSLMMYLFCEVAPKDINLNHNGQIQIDQEPVLLEGENFSMENNTYRKVSVLVDSFNEMFGTSFRIAEHIDLSETKHKCHRTFVEHMGFSDDKMFWCKDRKSWIRPGQHGYEKLKEEYIQNQGQQTSMPEIPKVDHQELMQKYLNGDLISYNPNADWLL